MGIGGQSTTTTTKSAPCKGLRSVFPTETTLAGHGRRLVTIYVHVEPGTNWEFAVGEKIVTSASV